MKYSKRYIVLSIIVLIVFLFKFHIVEIDEGEIGVFRGGKLEETVWHPLVADDVNGQVLTLSIDNKVYTSENYKFYMDDQRNIMAPVSILRDAFNCSAHIYNNNMLLVEKHNLSVSMSLNEAADAGAFVFIDGAYYVSINALAEKLGYKYSFDVVTNTVNTADASSNVSALPAKYDLREKQRISAIRNQGRYGTCWAFGALTAIESALLPEELYAFSVDHMSMSNSFYGTQYDGGEYTMGMAYLAAWQGPVYEADDPYGDGKTNSSLKAEKHVQEMRIIASKDISAIKEAVFKYGGVQTSLYSSMSGANGSSRYYNKSTSAYCYIGTEKPNHEVVIIGWDDNYPKENFSTSLEGDGAFICQNSWGENFGEKGVFYVSYYDTNIGTHNVVYTRIDDKDNYDHIYQTDLCGWVGKLGYEKESMYGANVFTAKRNEELAAIAFYATAPDTEYKLYVVNDFKDTNSFVNKKLVAEGSLDAAGYYTIDLEKAVSLPKGEKYAVVLYINTPGSTHPMAIEYDSGSAFLNKVNLDDGEGYISYSGASFVNVKDKQECNLCIKAFTNDK